MEEAVNNDRVLMVKVSAADTFPSGPSAYSEALIYCAFRPGEGLPGIFGGDKPLKMARLECLPCGCGFSAGGGNT
jgi:hypothetical protein